MTRPERREAGSSGARAASARERIDQTAYELFSRHGIRAVGVDKIIARSGVAKMTLFRHYPTKEQLALAFLRRREELWTRAWLQGEVERRANDPRERLLAIFDVFDKWFHRADFEGCSFINVLLEIDERRNPVRAASVHHLEVIRGFLRNLARDAGIRDPEAFARQWHILMKGSIVAASEGDREAARRAKEVGALLLESVLGEKRRTATRSP
jgi:AcrR family transcriptional regulator